MPPGPVSCIGGTKYPHCILYCIVKSVNFGDDMDKSLWITFLGHPVRFVGNFKRTRSRAWVWGKAVWAAIRPT